MEQPQEQWEMPTEEIAAQVGRHTEEEKAHPFEEGRKAALDGSPKSSNPHGGRGNWRRKPWSDGWNKGVADKTNEVSSAAIAAQQNGEEPEEVAEIEAVTPKTHRAPSPEQQILPGTEEFIPKYDPVIHAAAKSYAEARDARMAATKIEVERKALLLGLLTRDGLAGYQYEEVSVELTTDVKLKVRIKSEDDEGEE